jgi:hypothetical protein
MTPRRDELATVHPGRALVIGTVVDVVVVLAPSTRDEAWRATTHIHAATKATTIFRIKSRPILRCLIAYQIVMSDDEEPFPIILREDNRWGACVHVRLVRRG